MKNENYKKEKINPKKAIFSIVFMVLFIISTSYMFQSCDATILDPENSDAIDQLIEEFDKTEDDQEGDEETEITYFIYNLRSEIHTGNKYWTIESSDTSYIPTSLNVIEFSDDREFGWANLDGFLNMIDNGFCYFTISDNKMLLNSDDNSFIAAIDFNQCWQVENKIYSKMTVNGTEVLCYMTLIG
jgi:hypothetical protein